MSGTQRVAAGVPAGGQFATAGRPEAEVSLDADALPVMPFAYSPGEVPHVLTALRDAVTALGRTRRTPALAWAMKQVRSAAEKIESMPRGLPVRVELTEGEADVTLTALENALEARNRRAVSYARAGRTPEPPLADPTMLRSAHTRLAQSLRQHCAASPVVPDDNIGQTALVGAATAHGA